MSFPVALQLYSVRDAMAEDFAGTIKKVKDMGYDGVEFAGLFDHSAEEVKRICDEVGVDPISAHVPYDELDADPEKTIATYAEIGCKYIAIPYAVEERRPGAELFDDTVEGIKRFAAIGKKYGVTFLYHNHDFEFKKVGDVYGLDLLYSTLTPDELQTELDEREYDFTVGGGMITIKMNGKKEMLSIDIKPEVVNPDDIEMLQDLIVAGVNEAVSSVEKTNSDEMSKVTGNLNIPGMF